MYLWSPDVKRFGRAAAVACLMALAPALALAQETHQKVAVLNLEAAVFNTEEAKTQINALRQTADYAANKKQAETLKKQYDDLAAQFNKNRETLSAEQEEEQARKIKQVGSDLEFVAKKLQQSERELAQRIMREMMPRANTIVMDLIKAEGIGLLLNSQAALYAEPGFSLDAKVTEKLNQTKK
jgi:outer membrane protein